MEVEEEYMEVQEETTYRMLRSAYGLFFKLLLFALSFILNYIFTIVTKTFQMWRTNPDP